MWPINNQNFKIMKKQPFSLLGLSFPALLLTLLMTTTTSCKKVEGCTDSQAKNYNSYAETDDGSCTYQGEVVFWYTEAVSDELINIDLVTSLAYYVGGELVGSSSSSIYYTTNPNCGDNGTITVTRDLGTSKTKQYAFKVEDPTDGDISGRTITFEANTCITYQLQN